MLLRLLIAVVLSASIAVQLASCNFTEISESECESWPFVSSGQSIVLNPKIEKYEKLEEPPPYLYNTKVVLRSPFFANSLRKLTSTAHFQSFVSVRALLEDLPDLDDISQLLNVESKFWFFWGDWRLRAPDCVLTPKCKNYFTDFRRNLPVSVIESLLWKPPLEVSRSL